MIRPEAHSRVISGLYYRIKFVAEAAEVLSPAHTPEGRSHRNGQRALYLSATPEGTIVAVRRYVQEGDPARAIFPLRVTDARIVDLRDTAATAALGIDTTHRAAEWQPMRAEGLPSPTWTISDRVRDLGLDGMLYASRTDRAKTHLTLFAWNAPGSACRLATAGPPIPWP